MKFYHCLIQNDPIAHQISCFHILRCEEVDEDDKERLEALHQEFMKIVYQNPRVSVMFFHLPTKDVKMFMPGLPEGVFYYDFLNDFHFQPSEGSTSPTLALAELEQKLDFHPSPPIILKEGEDPHDWDTVKEHIQGEEGSTWEAWKQQVQRSREATRTFDEKWEEWKPGEKIVWTDDYFGQVFLITKINHDTGYVWWDDPAGGPEQMTRATNLYRVTLHDAEE